MTHFIASAATQPLTFAPLDSQPLVSVLIANHNYEDYIGLAIESVLAQTYSQLELIVCDDGSTDQSRAVIQHYAHDERVHVIQTDHQGQAAAWNAAYAIARGAILCTLDADDCFVPDKLATIVRYFQLHPAVGCLVHPMTVIDQTGHPIQQIPFLSRFAVGWIASAVVRRGGRWRFMPASTLCFRRELAEAVFPIPETLFRRTADGFVFTLAPLLVEVGYVDEALCLYRVHGENGMGSLQVDAVTTQRVLSSIERMLTGVNDRLQALGRAHLSLALDNNLTYREHQFFASLFAAKPRSALLMQYAALLSALWRDDLYSGLQKMLGSGVYALAIMLPMSLRSRWLSFALSYRPIKQQLQNLAGIIRRWRRG